MKTLGQRIRELREEQDVSLRELATEIHVSAAFMSDVELGRRNPSDRHLCEIARALKASLEDLAQFDTRPPLREFRRATQTNPEIGFAFRQMMEKEISAQELLDFIRERDERSEDGRDVAN